MEPADPINPQRIFWELSPRLPDNAILCGDCGSHTNWYARDVQASGAGMMASLSGKLATMGSGMPYAIAAKMAYPDRPVLAMVGDGAMQMNGNAELITVKQYWKQWSNPCFVVMVLANHDLNQVTWEQRALAGDPKFEAAQDVEDFPYARYAELLGLQGHPGRAAGGYRRAPGRKRSRRPPGGDRIPRRSGRAAVAAAYPLAAGAGLHDGAGQGRPERSRHHPPDRARGKDTAKHAWRVLHDGQRDMPGESAGS